MRTVTTRDIGNKAQRGEQLSHRRHRPDYTLLIIILVLLFVGVIVIYSISPALAIENGGTAGYYVLHQSLDVILGLIAFIIASRVPYDYWKRIYKPLLGLGAFATLLALVMPVNAQYPAHRWIRIGSFSFQSVELLKFAIVVWLAAFLSSYMAKKRQDARSRTDEDINVLKPLAIPLAVIGFVVAFIQSDFGSTVVIVAMVVSMLFLAGIPLKRLFTIGAIIVVVGILAISVVPYRRERLLAYLHPANTSNCSAAANGYQACQALLSVGSGGLIGLGLGRSVQAYGYLPEADNDSIFAIYAEKFGFIGSAVLVVLFGVLFARLKSIVERAPDDFSRLYSVAILAWLSVQMMINIGAMVGLLPLKGITLPLISYGGTSVVFIMGSLGVVFQISRYTSYSVSEANSLSGGGSSYESGRDGRRVRGAYHPGLSSGA
jgi:cell division protein FtsW